MSQPDADFRFIPVDMAAQIGADCNKDQVIVLAYDASCDMLSTATWGRRPSDKFMAARVGESITVWIGGDLSRSIVNEDFRNVPAAEAAARIEALLVKIEEARGLIEFMQQWFTPDRSLLKFWATWAERFPDGPTSWAEKAQAWLAPAKPPADEAARYDEHSPRVD